MARAPSFCGVILAAGESSRMGQDKALLPWPPRRAGGITTGRSGTFLSAAMQLLDGHSDMVVVVAGKNAPNLMSLVYSAGAFMVVNPEPERGQFSSLQVGLQEVLNRGRDAAIVTLVDRPPARAATVLKLKAEFLEAMGAGKWAVVPEFDGKHGHPIIVGREMIEAFLRAPATSNARDVEHHHQVKIQYLPVDDSYVTMNVDTPDDYARLQVLS